MNKERNTATTRLNMLPEIFSVQEFQKSQKLSPKAASVYLARWNKQGLIKHLGTRCGLWVNVAKTDDKQIKLKHKIEAVGLIHPQAILDPASVLKPSEIIKSDDKTFESTIKSDPINVIVPQLSSKAGLYETSFTPVSNRLFQYLEQNASSILSTPKGLVYAINNQAVALAYVKLTSPETLDEYRASLGHIENDLLVAAANEEVKMSQLI